VARAAGGSSEEYLYCDPSDPLRVSALRGPGGALSTLYYDDEGVLIAMERGGTMYYVGSDQVGSPRVVFVADGTVSKRVDYDSFGVATDQNPGFWLPIGFGGGLSDPDTGLVRFGMRDYDPAAGRFVAKDPSFFDGSPGNLYGYAGSDPVSLRDPSGLFCVGATLYDGVGGGGQFCRSNGKNSFCAEVGVGVGGGVAVEPFGDAKKDSLVLQAELTGKWGPLQAGVGAELDMDCFHAKGYVKGGLAVGGLQAKIDTDGKASWQSSGKSKSSYDGSGTRNSDGSWGTKLEGKIAMRKCWAF
jgi:RHS repeat-associated protein